MFKRAWISFLVRWMMLSSCALLAYEAPEVSPLTNADVVRMVEAGVPESTILLDIELAASRGTANFDTSPNGLIDLKKHGATEKVLNAILATQAAAGIAPQPRRKVPAISPVPGLPDQHGVYYRSSSGWIAMPSFLLWPPWRASWQVIGGFRNKDYGVALPGARARVQIAERRPTFYARDSDGYTSWQLVQVIRMKDHRELRVASGPDIFMAVTGFKTSDLREIDVTAAGGGVFTITPKTELDSGEYVLCRTVPGGHSLFLCHEFGINQ